jgi:nitrite reductase/ring-hydroxylating ferredoxin subunit
VLSESNLPDEKPVRVDHNGTSILLVRRGSQIYALAETCSHLGGPLSEGKLEEEIIQCPWHGSRFSIRDGRVIDGPAVHPQPCLEARIRSHTSGRCAMSFQRAGPPFLQEPLSSDDRPALKHRAGNPLPDTNTNTSGASPTSDKSSQQGPSPRHN